MTDEDKYEYDNDYGYMALRHAHRALEQLQEMWNATPKTGYGHEQYSEVMGWLLGYIDNVQYLGLAEFELDLDSLKEGGLV